MKLALISGADLPVPPVGHGAAERQVELLARGLAAQGHEVHVLAPGGETPAPTDGLTRHALGPGTPPAAGALARILHSWSFARRVLGRLADLRPDLTHWHAKYPLLFALAPARALGPVVFHAHNWKAAEGNAHLEFGRRWAAQRVGLRVEERLARCVDHVVAVSPFLATGIRRTPEVPADRVSVLSNLVDRATVPTVAPPANARPQVLFVGRLAAEKGVDTLIQAWPRVLARVPAASLTILGPDHGGTERGRYRRRLEERIRTAGLGHCVRIAGSLPHPEVLQRMGQARLVAVPSRWQEPCGMVALEALSVGRPVLASRVGGLAELVQEGVTGRLCTPDDPQDWARVLVEELAGDSELSARARTAGPEYVLREHTWPAVGPRLEELYVRLLEKEKLA